MRSSHLPGGIGTLEELVEQLTWAQLGRHKKPILVLNTGGFWDPLCALIDHMEVSPSSTRRRRSICWSRTAWRTCCRKLRDAARIVPEAEKFMQAGTAEKL